MGQEEVESSCSGSPQGLGKGLKLLKGLLVLVAKKDIDRFAFRGYGLIHMVRMRLPSYYLVPGELEV